MNNKSAADTAGGKTSTAVFGHGIHVDFLRILGLWMTVMSFFLASEEYGFKRYLQRD
jgi:hypothetical protein